MSEMSAEKKKQIERYIVLSYFSRCGNIVACVGGADIMNGSEKDDIPDLLVEVEDFSNSDFLIIRWNVLSESGSKWENEFILRFARELKTERNRCDSVDAMAYAWESWRSKIQGKPTFLKTNDEDLQKDKRIEELERTVKALRDEKEVMERHIQELKSQNVSLAETNAVLNNSWKAAAECNSPKELIEKLNLLHNDIAGRIAVINTYSRALKDWKEVTGCPSPSAAKTTIEYWLHSYGDAQKEIESLKEDLRTSNSTMQKELDNENDMWQKATGRTSPEEAKQYIGRLKDRLNMIRNYSVDW